MSQDTGLQGSVLGVLFFILLALEGQTPRA